MLDRHPEVIKQPNETHCMLSKRNYAILACRMLLTIISPCLTRGGVYPPPIPSPPEYSRWLKYKRWYWRETSQTFSYRKLTSFLIFVC